MNFILKSEYHVFEYIPKHGEAFHQQERYNILEYCNSYDKAIKYLTEEHGVYNEEAVRVIKPNRVIELKQYLVDLNGDAIIEEPLFHAQLYPSYAVYDENSRLNINKIIITN